jgi:hypothetical protein
MQRGSTRSGDGSRIRSGSVHETSSPGKTNGIRRLQSDANPPPWRGRPIRIDVVEDIFYRTCVNHIRPIVRIDADRDRRNIFRGQGYK